MKKILLLTAMGFIFQATPVLAEHHEGGDHKRGGKDRGAEMFKKSDTNADGMISQEEFLSKAKEKFSEKDINGDGNISQDEAKTAHEAKREKMKEKRKARKGDDHKKGEHKRGGKKRGAEMFEKNDANSDGVISQGEFLTKAKEKFSEKDINGDGNISQDEAKAAHEAKRAKMKEKHKARKDSSDITVNE